MRTGSDCWSTSSRNPGAPFVTASHDPPTAATAVVYRTCHGKECRFRSGRQSVGFGAGTVSVRVESSASGCRKWRVLTDDRPHEHPRLSGLSVMWEGVVRG